MIDSIEKTSDTLSDRVGLTLFSRYISKLEKYFGGMRKNKKEIPIDNAFKQLFCFFADVTSPYLTLFDEMAKDKGYVETIENTERAMLSFHSAKRFIKSFSPARIWKFRKLLQDLFIWRLGKVLSNIVIQGNILG